MGGCQCLNSLIVRLYSCKSKTYSKLSMIEYNKAVRHKTYKDWGKLLGTN